MISGPTIPRTPDGVRGLIQRHLGVAERGLAVVVEDLELGQDCEVDALARDAAGAPVLVFAAVPEQGRSLSLRVLAAYTWFRSHGRFLVREYAEEGLDPAAPLRLLVLGLDFLADTVRDLESLGLRSLEVHQFCSFTVGGEMRLGVTRLLGDAAEAQAEAAVDAGQPVRLFQVPSGLPPGPAADRCARFLDLVRRMDPRVTASGDRFSRQIHLGGKRLAELHVADGTPRVRVQGEEEHTLDCEEDCSVVVDRLVRQVLAAERLPESTPRGAPRLAHAARQEEQKEMQEGRQEDRHDLHEGLDEGRFSLEPIRQSVAAAKVSRDEYSALEHPAEDP